MLKKTCILLSCFSLGLLLISFKKEDPKPQQVVRTIVIDAGHGIMANGQRNGAKGSYSYEDDICLAVAKKLVAEVSKAFPNIRIVETRPTPSIVDLRERANIANQNHGDLFVSIHVNAMPPIQKKELVGYKTHVTYTGKGKHRKKHVSKVPQYRYYEVPNTREKGTQTYIWGAHKSEDKEVAVRENAPMLAEDNYQEKYGDVDPNTPEFIALSLLKTQQFAKRSTTLANMVEEEFSKVGRISGGPHQRQVGIWVLQATAMPSILVETGFITNPQEEDYLNSQEGQQEIAECITKAVRNYINWLEKRQISTGNAKTTFRPTPADHLSFLENIEAQEHKHTTK